MSVTIDYTSAVRQRAGIGRYTRSLIHALARIDQQTAYTLFTPHDARYVHDAALFPSNFRLAHAPLDERVMVTLWQRLRVPLPIELMTGASNVFYSPDFVLPPTRAHKKILTVHDLSFKRVPETAVPNLKWYLEGAVTRAVARADLIFADSDATRTDLIELFNVAPARVQTLYSGCEDIFRPVEDARKFARARETYKLTKPFILSVGTLEPRKNLTRLIEAFARLPQRADFELLIAGGRGWLYDEILQAPVQFGVEDCVRFLGFVPDADLPAVYSLATLFVYPSLYEGFGLPVLEAMACGAAVITSNVSSLPEVAGDAAVLINPRATDELADTLEKLLDDNAQRAQMKQQSLAQAQKFSWDASARQLHAAFDL